MDRLEGLDKLTGRERFVDDEPPGDALWGMTVRSRSARGRIREIRFDPGFDWTDVVVVRAADIPGPNQVRLIELDQPVLAEDRVRHIHEPVVLLAHADRRTLRRAVAAVRVEVEEEDPYLDVTAEPTPAQLQVGQANVLKELKIEKGDVDAALAGAFHVVEGCYETGAQEHVYLEPNGAEAWLDGEVLTVRGSLQCPYYVKSALMHALDRADPGVRVIQAPTGGAFGGKEDYPSVIALHTALLALKSGRRVRMIYDRGEDMAATTKRHPSFVRHRTGLDENGRLLAQEIEVVLDAGAYVTLSPVVLSRGIIHAAGPYACDHVRIRGRAMLSNSVPFGAFRGFGAPQTHFANERHMDVVADALGLDPIELRSSNLIRDGQSTATGQVIRDGADRHAVLQRALDLSSYRRRQQQHDAFNRDHPYLRRGIGVACFHHGAGFTGSGEVMLNSRVEVAGRADGGVEVRSANTEMGQGTLTIFTELVVRRLGLEASAIRVAPADTARVPDSGPTVASRTAMVVGQLVERACDDLLGRLGVDPGRGGAAVQQAISAWFATHDGQAPIGEARYRKPVGVDWDDATYSGDAYAKFAWATYVAEVEVDLRTSRVRVLDFTAVQEIGTVLHETLARGQIQGGVVQAIGWALLEDCLWQDGALVNNALTNYIVPTASDVCPIRVAFLEGPSVPGAAGAKGIGELPMDGPAPAIANAVSRATHRSIQAIPITPERLLERLSSHAV